MSTSSACILRFFIDLDFRVSTSSDVFITDVYKLNTYKAKLETVSDSSTPVPFRNPTDSAESIVMFKDLKNRAKEMWSMLENGEAAYGAKDSGDTDSTLSYKSTVKSKANGQESESAQPVQKCLSFCIDVSLMLSERKTNCQIFNIVCVDNFEESSPAVSYSESSGNLGDVSKTVSPSSATNQPYQLRPNRFSVMSSSSSSSMASSAAVLMQRMRDNKRATHKRTELKTPLTKERIDELSERWENSELIWNVLDYIDVNVIKNDEEFKQPDVKPPGKAKTPEKLEQIEEVNTPASCLGTGGKGPKPRIPKGKRKAKVKFTGSDGESPKKRQRKAGAKQTPIKILESRFQPGDQVFAKWTDRKFYAATLMERDEYDGKWKVNFFDGDHKNLGEDLLIKSDEFCMQGQRVYASHCDSTFNPGIITGYEHKNGEIHYIIARDDEGDISIPAKFILITESQARQIRNRMNEGGSPRQRTPPKKREEIISEMLPNKRATRSKTRMLMDSPKPSSSGTQRIVKSDSEDEVAEGNDVNFDCVPGIEPECQGSYEACAKMKGKAVAGKLLSSRFSRAKTNDVDAKTNEVLGLIPLEGSKIFKNLHVLLNCVRPSSPSFDNADSGSENFNFSQIPFNKDRLKKQLSNGGATVYNNFDDIPSKLWKSTYLISNKPNISAKYIQCLTIGIRLVCHDWVIRSCNENKAVPVQELPVGWSIEKQSYIAYHDRKAKWPLKKQKILVVDSPDNKNFYKFWSRICSLADAQVSKLTRDSNLEMILCVICESGHRDELVERVLSHSVPVVSTEWLVQTLIHGEIRDVNKTEYQTEYVDSE